MNSAATSRKTWCQHEAEAVAERISRQGPGDPHLADSVAFSAGFGPSGLPHIGTVCEVLRVSLVRKAFDRLGIAKTKLFIVSDDLDALRKIPPSFPISAELIEELGRPLSKIKDPFNKHPSLSEGINQRLINELAIHQLDYQFVRSSDAYSSGEYNETILRFLASYEALNEIVASGLGPVRRASYNIFMPISPTSGRVIEHIRILEIDVQKGQITYEIPRSVLVQRPGLEYSVTTEEYYSCEPIGRPTTISVLNGHCKLQWKADWAMRLISRNISFEMHGEDLTDSARTVLKICRELRHEPPILFRYGLFSDSMGKKISKTKGNGASLENIRRFIPPGGLQHFVFTAPKRPSRFHIGLSPSIVDKWLRDAQAYKTQPDAKRLENPSHYLPIEPLLEAVNPGYRKVLRIIDACAANNDDLVKFYLGQYGIDSRCIDSLDGGYLRHVVMYYRDVVLPLKSAAQPSPSERVTLDFLASLLVSKDSDLATAIGIQTLLHRVWQRFSKLDSIRDLYQLVYRCVLGQPSGPKLARHILLYGPQRFGDLIASRMHSAGETECPATTFTYKGDGIPSPTASTTPIFNSADRFMHTLRPISFHSIARTAKVFADHLRLFRGEIIRSLSGFECQNVAEDEIRRSIELLDNLEKNQEYFRFAIRGVTSFLPLNQPLYATVCFGAVPSLMADEVWVRPPTAMQTHYQRLVATLDLKHYFPNLNISYEEKEEFVARRAPVTDAVIFTGTPENARKVRSKFLRGALFILNGSGHNPLVISDNADVGAAVNCAMRVVLYNQGQDCAGPNSVLIHTAKYDEFIAKLRQGLDAMRHLVGPYESPQNIVGPNSDPDHAIKIARLFREERIHCTYGGDVNPVTGLIRPTIFEKDLCHGGNYREFFAPVFFIQRYDDDDALKLYFDHPEYHPNAMYITLFGNSAYISQLVSEGQHPADTVLYGADLHQVEKGYLPYGGPGPAASCLYVNGERKPGATLPQRDIYLHLVEPFLNESTRVEV